MKYLYGGLAGLFFLLAVADMLKGEAERALIGVSIGLVVLTVAIFLVPDEKQAIQDFQAWLVGHAEQLRRGALLYYEDMPVTITTELTQFVACFSFAFLTQSFSSRYLLRHSPQARAVRLRYTLLTLLFGWWKIPFGPIYTVKALHRNLRGGYVQTVGMVLAVRLAELAEEAEEAALDQAREQAAEREGRRLLG